MPKLFFGLKLTSKGLKMRPSVRIGRRVGVTINKRGIWPSWLIKR